MPQRQIDFPKNQKLDSHHHNKFFYIFVRKSVKFDGEARIFFQKIYIHSILFKCISLVYITKKKFRARHSQSLENIYKIQINKKGGAFW